MDPSNSTPRSHNKRKKPDEENANEDGLADADADSLAESNSNRIRSTKRRRSDVGWVPQPPKYIIEKGLRKVEPYEFHYSTFAKGRWYGRTLIDVFSKEFQDHPESYYRNAIECGRITVNGEPVTVDYIVKNSDRINHVVHRHEPPVASTPVRIAYREEDLWVVDKPSSIPIHPTGRYNHNTLLPILAHENSLPLSALHPCNRLDRLTSGLVLIALSKPRSRTISSLLSSRTLSKSYLARVRGVFPEKPFTCSEPIETVSHKLGLNRVSSEGKPCATEFEMVSTTGTTSLVICRPLTGRTHQIRVHLMHLGFPIANDPIYCTDFWTSEIAGSEGSEEAAVREFAKVVFPDEGENTAIENVASNTNTTTADTSADATPPLVEFADGRKFECARCVVKKADPVPEMLGIYLHMWKYEWDEPGGNGETLRRVYQTEMPDWGLDDVWTEKDDTILAERFWKYGGKWDGVVPGTEVTEEQA
ncbi:pseudouridine synthase [Cladochytrium replicatum]|nr:pseudouridine synthase [Cladochytrium replicatum]